MVEFDPLYKIVSGTCGTFPNRRCDKKGLFTRINFFLEFSHGVVIRVNNCVECRY